MRSSVGQLIPLILWNPKVHYRIHKSPPPVPILIQINKVKVSTAQALKTHFNIILSSKPWPFKCSFSLMFLHQNPVYSSPLPHTCYMPRPSYSCRFDHPNKIGVGSTDHEAPSYVVFSTHLLPRLS